MGRKPRNPSYTSDEKQFKERKGEWDGHAARELDGIRSRAEQGKHWGSSGRVGKMRSAQAEAAPTPPPAPPAPPLCPFLINTVVYHSQVPCLNDSTAVIWISGNPYNLGHAWF